MGFLSFTLLILFFSILLKLMIIFAVIFLVSGLMLLKTHETIAIILFILSGFNLFGFIAWKIYEYNFKETIVTSDGEVKIKQSKCLKYEEYVESANIKKINGLLDKYPEMIYYKIHDENKATEIINIVKFALEHGAEVVYENWNLYERAEKWVLNDGIVSRKDKELLELIKNIFRIHKSKSTDSLKNPCCFFIRRKYFCIQAFCRYILCLQQYHFL